ncbi:MAG: TIGR01212 family radical SAM protein [Clostridia bacterium]|nr:TIGR01212 family radical SAM protein [Clostridia bacterium]
MEKYTSISTYLKDQFGHKTIKLAIDGGFTCPNRDGSKGVGGCIFCSDTGSGEFASNIDEQIALYQDKWPDAYYLGYFQNHTNTYAPVSELREKYYKVLENPKIKGLVIGTRPDCLGDDVLDLLEEINKEHFMWVELGLQSIHEKTARFINRCYDQEVFDEALKKLQERNIKVVVHIILGLPGETKEDMLESVKYVADKGIFGIKLHLLNVVKGSRLEEEYSDYQPFESIEEYAKLVVGCLEVIPESVTIHRLTGDAPRKILISPPWSYKKRTILNTINEELKKSKTYQGRLYKK